MTAHDEWLGDLAERAAGRLPPDRLERLESHLDTCAGCAEAAMDFDLLGRALRDAGEDLFEPHPASEALGRFAAADPGSREGDEVRRHLAVCAGCSLEVEMWRRTRNRLPVARSRALPGRWSVGLLSAAAGILLGASLVLLTRPGPAGDPAAHLFLPASPTRSDAMTAATWRPPEDARTVVVSFRPAFLATKRGPSPFRLEIVAPDGKLLWSKTETAANLEKKLDVGGAVAYAFPRSLFTPGRYLFRITAVESPEAPPEYQVAIEVEPPQ